MGKAAAPRRLADNAAIATSNTIRISPRKLNLVVSSIRGLKIDSALVQLSFSSKHVAGIVRHLLQSAIANAENNHHLDVDQLYVAEAYVGKGLVMKRWMPRARSRVNRVLKPFSHLTIIVREREGKNG